MLEVLEVLEEWRSAHSPVIDPDAERKASNLQYAGSLLHDFCEGIFHNDTYFHDMEIHGNHARIFHDFSNNDIQMYTLPLEALYVIDPRDIIKQVQEGTYEPPQMEFDFDA